MKLKYDISIVIDLKDVEFPHKNWPGCTTPEDCAVFEQAELENGERFFDELIDQSESVKYQVSVIEPNGEMADATDLKSVR